ncbi:MAG: thioredoxin domain-containing protein [bacterium]
MLKQKKQYNKLKDEKSPYLQQHAANPVNWYPWNESAFKKAKKEDKPVFLSIGYSTCHWCHVMAHESFEDKETAELINKTFIAIKVDREERPDIDNVYMRVCQIMNGNGGWPLTIILTPDKKPFFAATYLPKKSSYSRKGLIDLIPEIEDLWNNKREKVYKSADSITVVLNSSTNIENKGKENQLDFTILKKAYSELVNIFDKEYGGFGSAPKFPMSHQLRFLLNYAQNDNTKEKEIYQIKNIIDKTLTNMRAGGIYDHLGYGFHRYSTNKKWILPHFEKMLYDQALLIYLYTEAYQFTNNSLYKNTVLEICDYIRRIMLSDKGGFFSAEDADSEGEEGKFYIWTENQIEEILNNKKLDEFKFYYNIKNEGNFRDESSRKLTGNNILYVNYSDITKTIDSFKIERKMLFEKRIERIRPEKDDKILTDWNGMLIAALSKAAFVFNDSQLLLLAENAANFIINNLYKNDKLYHRFKDGDVSILANLNDYAFMIWGLIELYQATFNIDYLKKAILLTKKSIDEFWDKKNGGFYFSGKSSEKLITNTKEVYDGAIPSGNSINFWNIQRLYHLTGKKDYNDIIEKMLKVFSSKIADNPSAYSQFLIGINTLFSSYYDLILVGDLKETQEFLNPIRQKYIPNVSIIQIPVNKAKHDDYKIIDYLDDYSQKNNKTTAYICKNKNCSLPTNSIQKMLELLDIRSKAY